MREKSADVPPSLGCLPSRRSQQPRSLGWTGPCAVALDKTKKNVLVLSQKIPQRMPAVFGATAGAWCPTRSGCPPPWPEALRTRPGGWRASTDL